jgi:sporulation protein YlmC with PRC-barrel domain
MMNARWRLSLAACTAVVLCGALLTAAAEPTVGQNQPAMPGPATTIQNSTLIGAAVLDLQGQKLGQIRNTLLDPSTGLTTFVVLDAQVSGSGHAMIVVPYPALRVSVSSADGRPSAVLNLRPEQLSAAPQIQNDQWEVLQSPQFLEQARNFYQIRTYTVASPIAAGPSCPMTTYYAGPVPWLDFGGYYGCCSDRLPEKLEEFFSE